MARVTASMVNGLGAVSDYIPFWWSEREVDPCAPSAAWCYWMPGASYFKECEPMDPVKCASAINRPPPTVTPAAPQSYGTMTIPGAWSPAEAIGQTQTQQRIAQSAYSAGNQATGPRAAGETPVAEIENTYATVALIIAAAVVTAIVVRR